MMNTIQSLRLISVIALLSVLCPCIVAAADSSSATQKDLAASPVAAYVGGHKITLSEVEQAQPDQIQGANAKILSAKFAAYMAERQATLQAIDDQLLAKQAAKEHLSVDELTKREVTDKIKPPSEETLQIYYLGAQTEMPYSEARDKIIAHVAMLQQKKMLKDYTAKLREQAGIRIVLLPPRVDVTAGDSPSSGPADAPVTMIEFADFQCPYCRQTEPTVNKLREQYKGKLRYVFKNFPLPSHQLAEKAAEAALCAGQQGQYWPYHDQLFTEAPTDLDVPGLKKTAADLKLDTSKFDNCLDSGAEAASVKRTIAEGRNIGIGGTPSFTINGYFIGGGVPEEIFTGVIDQQIAATSAQAARNDLTAPRQAATQETTKARGLTSEANGTKPGRSHS